jgi:sulfur transfer protein SufE
VEHLTHKVKLVADSLEREKQLEAKQRLIIQQLEKDLAEVQRMETEYEKLIQSQETDVLMEEERVKYEFSLYGCNGYVRRMDMSCVEIIFFDAVVYYKLERSILIQESSAL